MRQNLKRTKVRGWKFNHYLSDLALKIRGPISSQKITFEMNPYNPISLFKAFPASTSPFTNNLHIESDIFKKLFINYKSPIE